MTLKQYIITGISIFILTMGAALGIQSFGAQSFGATVLTTPQGGTGTSTLPSGQLLYGSGQNPIQSVATTSASCSGSTSCSAFTVIGSSPITISSSGGSSGVSTTSFAATYPIQLSTSPTINYSIAFGTTTANTWNLLQTFTAGFLSNSSSTITTGLFSANGGASTTLLSIGTGTFLQSAATSTFGAGIAGTFLNLTGTSATSTAANGINLSGGCFSISGTCITSSSAASTGSTTPTILDAFNLTLHSGSGASSYTVAYTVPSSGSHQLFVFNFGASAQPTSITINGGAATIVKLTGVFDRVQKYVAYRAAPTTGNVVITFSGTQSYAGVWYTLQNAAQTNSLDVQFQTNNTSSTFLANSTTTTVGNDFLFAQLVFAAESPGGDTVFGHQGEYPAYPLQAESIFGPEMGLTRSARSVAGLENVTVQFTTSDDIDIGLVAFKAF